MKADHIVEALTGDSEWKDMIPQVDSSDFPTQWVPSAYECSIIDAQAKEIEKLRAKLPRWIPVAERLPENGVRVLAFNMRAKNKYIGIWTREKDPGDGNDCWFDSAGWWYAFDEITHWMPLPEPPEVELAHLIEQEG